MRCYCGICSWCKVKRLAILLVIAVGGCSRPSGVTTPAARDCLVQASMPDVVKQHEVSLLLDGDDFFTVESASDKDEVSFNLTVMHPLNSDVYSRSAQLGHDASLSYRGPMFTCDHWAGVVYWLPSGSFNIVGGCTEAFVGVEPRTDLFLYCTEAYQ